MKGSMPGAVAAITAPVPDASPGCLLGWSGSWLTPEPSRFVFAFSPVSLGFVGPSQEHSAYQTIDSPEAPADFYSGPEGKGYTPQGC